MYSVIILNKHTSDLLQDYKYLFKPFVDEGLIGFCDWNESGTDVKSSVPDLYNLIKGKKEWRAIIVSTESVYDYMHSPVPTKENPFDFSNVDKEVLPHISPIPLIRLTHIIGGYNAVPVKEFEKGFEYIDDDGQVQRVAESILTMEEIQELSNKYEDLKSIYIEKEIPAEILKAQAQVSELYSFSDTRPVEIHLISTRKKITDNEHARIAESWKNHLEMSSSSFWESNKYPNNCRFLFYDVCNPDNSLYYKEITEFWISVLTFTINHVAASTLQAYRLYRLGVEIDRKELAAALNNQLNKLQSALVFVKEQLLLSPEYSFDEDEEVLSRLPVPVAIDSKDSSDLYIDISRIGFAKDCPEDEMTFWKNQSNQKRTKFDRFLKQPRRAIDKSAAYLRNRAESFEGDFYQLNDYQIDDLHEIMEDLEQDIIFSDIKTIINRKKIQEEFKAVDKEVRREINNRMRKKTVVIAGLIALLICLVGFIPYIIASGSLSSKNLIAGVFVTVIVLIVSAFGGFLSLIIQRGNITRKMNNFNKIIRSASNSVLTGASKFEEYFTDICTYMKGQSILDGINNRKTNNLSVSNLLNSHKAALKKAMERDKEWMISYGLERQDEMIPNVTTYFRTDELPLHNDLYYFVPEYDTCIIPVNSTGDTVFAPYKFVSRLIVAREHIFEESAEV